VGEGLRSRTALRVKAIRGSVQDSFEQMHLVAIGLANLTFKFGQKIGCGMRTVLFPLPTGKMRAIFARIRASVPRPERSRGCFEVDLVARHDKSNHISASGPTRKAEEPARLEIQGEGRLLVGVEAAGRHCPAATRTPETTELAPVKCGRRRE
jgi:hypothetical protein